MVRSLARARSVGEWRDAGKRAAAVLRNDGFQLEAAFAAGLSEPRYYEALSGDSEGHLAFQTEVLPALFEQAKKAEVRAEADIASGENGSSAWANWHKWKLSQRYRKIFGDLAQKVEVTGKDGGPIKTLDMAQLPTEQLIEMLKESDREDDE